METVTVGGGRPYPVWITRGGAGRAVELMEGLEPHLRPSAWALVSDARVEALHGAALRRGLASWGDAAAVVHLPEGETAKTWEVAGELVRRLAAADLGRDAAVVCLGGGSVADVGGFAASVLLRGIDVVQVPTTLLAAVDASIGGKTGVNLPEGKNLAGAFHPPRAVLVDLELLETLTEAEWRNGWAEVVKVAVTSEPELFALLEEGGPGGARLRLCEVVARASRAKARIVTADERETGARRVLNFGHTVGHAIEAADGYRRAHGEAVALGISCALELGRRLGLTPAPVAERVRSVLAGFGLPVSGSGLAPEALRPYLGRDKKRAAGALVVVLTEDVGRPILRALAAGDPDLDAAIRAIA